MTAFIGRKYELKALEACYASDTFQMLVLYGRRRVGKTTLLEEFASGKPTLFFTAQMQADADNLRDFSHAVAQHFGMPRTMPPFASWLDAFEYIAERAQTSRFIFVFDEFPYAARANAALPSALQIAIDRAFQKTRCLMILCGSNQGFMEEEVLGAKSPLYGRRTAQLKLKPFDYRDTARMLPECSAQERISYYASLGGTPYYLAALRHDLGYIENMANLFFTRAGMMFDEPHMLMRQELREPAVYSSIMRALANGLNRSSEIADRVGVPPTSVTAYLKTLIDLDLVERAVPFGESERSKRSLYRIKDPAFLFWYRFVAPHVAAIEGGLGEQIAFRLLESDRRREYEGHLFERVCREWMVRQAQAEALPIQVTAIGSWWGTDPIAREQADIDVVASDEIEHRIILGECKWRNDFNVSEAIETLKSRQHLIPGYRNHRFFLFSKHPLEYTAKADAATYFISAEDMFK